MNDPKADSTQTDLFFLASILESLRRKDRIKKEKGAKG